MRTRRSPGANGEASSADAMRNMEPPARGNPLAAGWLHVWWAVLLITATGTLARVLFLFRPIGYDEAYTYLIYASGPLSHILGSYYPNNHVLHTTAMAAAASVFGSEPWALRLPALVAGVVCIPVAFLLGRRLHGEGAGLAAAALVAGSSVLIEYSTNGRGYSMLVLSTLLLFLVGARLLRRASAREWILAGTIGALGLFTVPVMAFAIAGWNLWLLASLWANPQRGEKGLFVWSLAMTNLFAAVLTALLYLPALMQSGVGAFLSNQWVRSIPSREVLPMLPHLLAGSVMYAARDWLSGPVVILVFTLGALASSRVHPSVRLLVPAGLLAIVALVAVQRVVPHPRMLISVLPLVYVTAACGMAMLGSWALPRVARTPAASAIAATVLASICVGSILARAEFPLVSETGAMPAAPLVAAYLADHVEEGDVVLIRVPGNAPLYYYLMRRGVPPAHVSLAPTDWLHRGLQSARRVYLVVNEPVESLPEVDAEMAEVSRSFGPPRRVAEFPQASVYLREAITTDRSDLTAPPAHICCAPFETEFDRDLVAGGYRNAM